MNSLQIKKKRLDISELTELQKLREKREEIKKQKKRLEDLQNLNLRIEAKKEKMKVFDDFLRKVLDNNADEFPEVNDIVSRYKTLKQSNDKLKAS